MEARHRAAAAAPAPAATEDQERRPISTAQYELSMQVDELSAAMRAAAAREDFASAADFQRALVPLQARLTRASHAEAAAERVRARAGTLTLTLNAVFAEFTPEMEAEILRRLAAHGGVSRDQLVVLSRRAGSVILEVALVSPASLSPLRACSLPPRSAAPLCRPALPAPLYIPSPRPSPPHPSASPLGPAQALFTL